MDGATGTITELRTTNPFDWPLAHDAEQLLRGILAQFLDRNGFARELSDRMSNESATDFFEWIDHFTLAPDHQESLEAAGFVAETGCETPNGETLWTYPRATLPRVLVYSGGATRHAVALRPESVADFVGSQGLEGRISGEPFGRYRRVEVACENDTVLEAVERHAYRGFVEAPLNSRQSQAILKARELWRTRPRQLADAAEGFQSATEVLKGVLDLVDRDRACQYFFENERAYWQSRNRAARIQKHRQDQLGLGWGNHDHHTFRCSRRHFVDFIEFLLKLGFGKRERFYAGAEAGWGAQILEHPVTGIVVFADVDLLPEETNVDFSSVQLPPTPRLGTVGLWVGLHGESFLEAGMHHLEARFDFSLLKSQLTGQGIGLMAPFSDFEFLRQAFTEGERWTVRRQRLQELLSSELITREQFERFAAEGAIGSHLENLQRHGGFKGFNQRSVSAIIAATDPRTAHLRGG